MYEFSTCKSTSLQYLQQMHQYDGPPLPLDQQLCWPSQSQVFFAVRGLHLPTLSLCLCTASSKGQDLHIYVHTYA
eukprot:m.121545 g.121545  ORF g.121545 m.121545 type:complete len:75 (+) comp23284_c0_seq2:355-579(+)